MNGLNENFITTLDELSDPGALQFVWRRLERRSDHSFFQSWTWIGCLLDQIMPDLRPRVLTVRSGGEIVGLGLLVRRDHRRNGFVRSRGLYLNETGDPRIDKLTMEYNGILAERGLSRAVTGSAVAWLKARGGNWNELYLGGLAGEQSDLVRNAARENGLRVWLRYRKRCDFVDLDGLRRSGGDYLASLSRNTRYQLRRAMRLHGGEEALSLEIAASVPQALAFLEGLKALHQSYWTGKGFPGSFANPFFERFHKTLIERCFGDGEIQLCRISAPGRNIGYLFNFSRDGRIYAYQSGFDYGDDGKLKPGLVSHYLAVKCNLEAGAAVYDFMAGEGQHKRSLGDELVLMDWLVLQRNRPALRLEQALRDVKAGMRTHSPRASTKKATGN